MKRTLSAVLAGCASTALMWVVLGRIEQLAEPLRPFVAVGVGVAALLAALALLPREAADTSIGSENEFSGTGYVEVDGASIDDSTGSIAVGTGNTMRDGKVVVRDTQIGKGSSQDE